VDTLNLDQHPDHVHEHDASEHRFPRCRRACSRRSGRPRLPDHESLPTPAAYYHYDGKPDDRAVQERAAAERERTTATNDFQVIFYPNGEVVYQYLTMNAVLKNSATIGMQNAGKNDGLQVVFNANYVKNNLAIRFGRRRGS